MPAGVVVDTSFLISLADPTREHHSVARQYWKEFLTRGVPIYLSTIVVSEFCLKQEIPPDILRACVVLPFNWVDAMQVARLGVPKSESPGQSGARDRVKDDIKIIAQAAIVDAALVITDDEATFHKRAKDFAKQGAVQFRSVLLADGFDEGNFSPSGQRSLAFGEEGEEIDDVLE
jgi:predicted nucleic acid-binding protein